MFAGTGATSWHATEAPEQLADLTTLSPVPLDEIDPDDEDRGRRDFDYHKEAWPLVFNPDGLTFLLASLGIIIAAAGGIGGGGILVPLYMLVLRFLPKHAIALSNITILGGSIANTLLNARKRRPSSNEPLIDWDLILIMEPLTIFGAVFGTLLSKVLPNIVITATLCLILVFMGERTLRKGIGLWRDETLKASAHFHGSMALDMELSGETDYEMCKGKAAILSTSDSRGDIMRSPKVQHMGSPSLVVNGSYIQFHSRERAGSMEFQRPLETKVSSPKLAQKKHLNAAASEAFLLRQAPSRTPWRKIGALTLCCCGTFLLTLLRGGGHFPSPLGFSCGSTGYWALFFAACPWVLLYAAYFRHLLMAEHESKVAFDYEFALGEVHWDSWNTIKYPVICGFSGLLAGMFGVGGGIVKGPLMLEMGITPSVASATAATMILFTSSAATGSFAVFGLLEFGYGAVLFVLGFLCTTVGQILVTRLMEKSNRQSPVVLSIGAVIAISSFLIGLNTLHQTVTTTQSWGEMLQLHSVCSAA